MRNLIRALTLVALSLALSASAAAPVPEDLPPPSFGQSGLYRLEIALLVFYGVLLFVTPAFSGLLHGRLPIEISMRGARFAGETDESIEAAREAINNLEEITDELAQGLSAANLQIKQMSDHHE
jgi:hypothetical protein